MIFGANALQVCVARYDGRRWQWRRRWLCRLRRLDPSTVAPLASNRLLKQLLDCFLFNSFVW